MDHQDHQDYQDLQDYQDHQDHQELQLDHQDHQEDLDHQDQMDHQDHLENQPHHHHHHHHLHHHHHVQPSALLNVSQLVPQLAVHKRNIKERDGKGNISYDSILWIIWNALRFVQESVQHRICSRIHRIDGKDF